MTRRLTLLAALLSFACASDPDRPPAIDVCDNGNCTGSGPSTSGTGSGGSGGSSSEEIVILTGIVAAMNDDSFESLSSYSGTATLFAQAADGQIVEAEFDGRAFAFTDIRRGQGTLVEIVPDSPEYMPALVAVDTTEPLGGVSLPVVRRSLMEELLISLSTQSTLDETRGQAVFSFVDESEQGVPGVFVTASSASDVAYREGTTWTDVAIGSGSSGLVAAFNMPASDLGASGSSVQLTGSVEGAFVVPLVAGAVTLARYRVAL